ncbi:MAG: amidohydrolase family protein, partial [Planctomycetota bacterium]
MDHMPTTRNRLIDHWNSRIGEERHLRVRWLMNPDEEPRRGAEIVEQSGVIVDVRPLSEWQAEDVWPVIATPPLVNCHTHLEFSSITDPLRPADPFPDWIRSLMKWRRDQPENASPSAISSGIEQSQSAGVAAVGEITTTDLTKLETQYSRYSNRLAVISFREIIGLRPDRIQEQLKHARNHLAIPVPSCITRGLSPHAPYTVHPDLLNDLAMLARNSQAPMAMHLAETRDELELLEFGSGRMADFLQSLELFDSSTFPGGRSIRECLEQLAYAPRSLVVHGNYLNNEDIAWLQRHPQCTIVYCPRTHAYFGHERYPLERFFSAGLRVALGTDSRASNPDLNLWSEVQHVARTHAELPIGTLIALATSNAVEALG